MKKKTIVEQRVLKSKTGKERKGLFKFSSTKTTFSTNSEEDSVAIKDWLDENFSNQPSQEKKILKYIDDQESLAKKVIRKAGLEPDDSFLYDDFKYKLLNGNKCNYDAAIAERKSRREPEGYAQDILENARILKSQINEKNIFGALYWAIKMEQAYGDFNLAQYELEILIGADLIAKGASSAEFSTERKADWIIKAKRLFEEEPSNCLKNNGSRNYKMAAMQILVDERLPSCCFQTVYRSLLNNKEKM